MDAPPVHYVTTSDGVSIAYAVTGAGEPLVLMPQRFSHIEIYWTPPSPVRPWLEGLAARFRLIQYDGRGQGMSSRGLAADLSMADLRSDLEAVVDQLRLDRFVLFAFHWHSHIAIEYAIRNPERVSALILAACSIDNRAWPMAIYETLAGRDWDAFLRNEAAIGQAADIAASVQRLKQYVNQSDWLELVKAVGESNLQEALPQLQAPTLVLHPRNFFNLPIEEAMKLAARVPNARVVLIDGALYGDATQGIKAIEDFLAEIHSDEDTPLGRFGDPTTIAAKVAAGVPDALSAREVEVLRLIAAGKSNAQIADELVISQNTVIRHVSNIFAKIGAANRTEAASYAHRNNLT